MDPLSISTAILAILSALSSTIGAVSGLVEARHDLKELHIQLHQLSLIAAEAVEAVRSSRLPQHDTDLLGSILVRLRAVHEKFATHIATGVRTGLSKRLSRLVWARRRTEIKLLVKEVASVRHDLGLVLTLSTILSTNNLYEYCIGSACQVGDLRSCSKGCIGGNPATPSASAFAHSVHEDQVSDGADLQSQSTWSAPMTFRSSSKIVDCVEEAGSPTTPSSLVSTSHMCGSVEQFRNFFPEQYIVEQNPNHRLYILSMTHMYRTASARADRYYFLFPKTARHWRRVIVIVTSPTTSQQSAVSALRHHGLKLLPGSVQPMLEILLHQIKTYKSVTKIHIELQENTLGCLEFDPTRCQTYEDLEEALANETSQHIKDLEYRGLRQYCEAEVVTLAREHVVFYVLVSSQVCVECKVPFVERTTLDRDPVGDFVASMKRLLLTQGCLGVPKFLGVIVDDQGAQLRGYLLRAPLQGRMWGLMAGARRAGQPIPWTRREQWFRQLIAITADFHMRGMVTGCSAQHREHLWVNAEDNIEIMGLSSYAVNVPNRLGYLPPEVRSVTKPGQVSDRYDFTLQIDIFNLGFLLWHIAQDTKPVEAIFCRANRCDKRPHHTCTASHANPIELPACYDAASGVNLPDYVNIVISHCRRETPSERRPAVELLQMLPPKTEPQYPLQDKNRVLPWHDAQRVPQDMTCNECSGDAALVGFRCNICDGGDFDLCTTCYEDGIWCGNENHSMFRRVLKRGQFVIEPQTPFRAKGQVFKGCNGPS